MIYECLILAACWDLLVVGSGCYCTAPCTSAPTAQKTQAQQGFQEDSDGPLPEAWIPPGPLCQRKLMRSC